MSIRNFIITTLIAGTAQSYRHATLWKLLPSIRKGSPESPLYNLTGDALIWMAKEYMDTDADVSIYNAVSITNASEIIRDYFVGYFRHLSAQNGGKITASTDGRVVVQ